MYDSKTEELLEAQVTEDYTPAALDRKPYLSEYETKVANDFLQLNRMRPEGFTGALPITLREIDLHLTYYPVDDVFYFIDLMTDIDRQYIDGIKSDSKDRRGSGGGVSQTS